MTVNSSFESQLGYDSFSKEKRIFSSIQFNRQISNARDLVALNTASQVDLDTGFLHKLSLRTNRGVMYKKDN